jgi:hypothetical protein
MKIVRPIAVTTANLTSNVAQTEALWAVGTTYSAAAAVYEVVDGVPMRFVSKAGGNVGNRPSLDLTETYWDPQGPTNRWAMFDGTIQSQTTKADSISVSIQLAADEALDTVRVANISAATLTVTVEDPVEGEIYDQTYDLTSVVGIDDYLPYFTEPIIRLRGKTLTDLPSLYTGVTVTVTLSAPGETVACGQALVGLSRALGGTRWGSELGFRDLSVKDEDDFGGLIVVKRAFKRTGSFDVIVQAAMVDELQRLLEDYRAERVLFIGDEAYDTMAIYGFVKAFKTQVSWPTHSLCSLDLESLA